MKTGKEEKGIRWQFSTSFNLIYFSAVTKFM